MSCHCHIRVTRNEMTTGITKSGITPPSLLREWFSQKFMWLVCTFIANFQAATSKFDPIKNWVFWPWSRETLKCIGECFAGLSPEPSNMQEQVLDSRGFLSFLGVFVKVSPWWVIAVGVGWNKTIVRPLRRKVKVWTKWWFFGRILTETSMRTFFLVEK